jgi:hypothetical protein
VTVEAVLVIPVLMVIVLLVVQFALWAHAAQVVQLAASEGDRAARTAGGGAGAGRAGAEAVLASSGSVVTSGSATVSMGADAQVTVTVTGQAEAVLPWLRLPVSATQVGPVQEFRTEALVFGKSEGPRGSNPSVSALFEAHWDPRVPRPKGDRLVER